MPKVLIVSAPSNPFKKPKGTKNKKFNLYDKVVTPQGYEGTVIEIEHGYKDREDKWHKGTLYRLDLPNILGSPQVLFAGWQLKKRTW